MYEMYDNEKHVTDTFTSGNLSEYLIQAQWAEFIELKKVIFYLSKKLKTPLNVLDIGIGNARILKHLVGIKEIWNTIGTYEGIDIAENCVTISNNVINELGITDRARVKLLDAVKLNSLSRKYDLIISTWFTVGNFYPSGFNFSNFVPGYDMSTNDKFTTIFEQAYKILNPGGQIIIGSVYIDNKKTREHQESSYRQFGWEIITDERDCFTATKDGWWSQRFTKKRIINYLPFIKKENIYFLPLDTYRYAMMVKIKK